MTNSKVGVAVLASLWTLPSLAAASMVLTSVSTKTPPVIDGAVDDSWNAASTTEITVDKLPYKPDNGYPGMTSTTVSMRSMHDAEHVYFLVQYGDPAQSIERFPWIKQTDGSWLLKANKDSTGHENTYYEDKLAILWDINARGFAKKGCDAACHMAENGKVNGIADTSAGRKYTSREGQTIDMWHWKSVRSNPVNQVDDQFIDSTKDPKANRNWGRKGDSKPGGGYKNNVNKDTNTPTFMPADGSTGSYWLLDSEKTDFVDTFKAGDVLPSILVSPFQGSRGDIQAKGVWHDGVWTIEMKRKLVTSGENADAQDVQFRDLAKRYDFGIAVFDNSQINHIYHEGVATLEFAQ